MAILCHFIGCFWNLLAYWEHYFLKEDSTWMHNLGMWELEWYKKYAECFYWATATIMLIGTKPDTFVETIFTTVMLFITIGFFAVILGEIGKQIFF